MARPLEKSTATWQVIFGSTDFVSSFHEKNGLIVKLFKPFNRLICFMNINTVIITYFAYIDKYFSPSFLFWGGPQKTDYTFFYKIKNHIHTPYFNLKGEKKAGAPKNPTGSTSPRSPASQTDLNE